MKITRIKGLCAGCDYKLRAKVALADGAWAAPAGVSEVHAKVSLQGRESLTFDGALSSVVLDSFVVDDDHWLDDTNDDRTQKGYNFSWVIPGSAFPSRGWYSIELRFTDTSGRVTKLLYEGAASGSVE